MCAVLLLLHRSFLPSLVTCHYTSAIFFVFSFWFVVDTLRQKLFFATCALSFHRLYWFCQFHFLTEKNLWYEVKLGRGTYLSFKKGHIYPSTQAFNPLFTPPHPALKLLVGLIPVGNGTSLNSIIFQVLFLFQTADYVGTYSTMYWFTS